MSGLLEFVFEDVASNNLEKMVVECVRERSNISEVVQDGARLRLDSAGIRRARPRWGGVRPGVFDNLWARGQEQRPKLKWA